MAEVLTDQIDLNVWATPNLPALEPEHHVNPIHLSWSCGHQKIIALYYRIQLRS